MPKEPKLKTANILFIDIVGSSKLKSDKQVIAVKALNKIIKKSLGKQPKESRLVIPTGDGMAIAFLENPEAPLLTAFKIAPLLKNESIPVRMGMHAGLVYLVEDINKQRNIVGGGINMAERVMSCGDREHILASRSIAESLSQVKEEYERLFHYVGEFEVKHGKVLELFNVYNDVVGRKSKPKKKLKGKITKERRQPSLHNQTPPEPNFVGRTGILETITEWYKDTGVNIGALIAWGGEGKSAIVRKWFDGLEKNSINPDGIFWWGFYRNAYLEQFLDSLLSYLAPEGMDMEGFKSTWAKAGKIKEFIQQGEYLIVLDGLEEMQKGEESGSEFGSMKHRECSEILRGLADSKDRGLCLVTTRYPLTDINKWEGRTYQKEDIQNLSPEEGRALFKRVGVKGTQKEMDAVIEDYKGHALSLSLLANYLVQDFKGDILKTKDIPPFYSDEEAGGKAHRMLQWYDGHLTDEQRTFMKIFSLFRRAVNEDDFKGVFRSEMETPFNQPLKDMKYFSFIRMVDNLSDRRLITKESDNTYSTHPLIKNYFESVFDKTEKKLCHKGIYRYIGTYAPERPMTLEEMQPLFEQVYHGCRAGFYQETLDDVYLSKIQREREFYLIHKLGVWETDLNLILNFFPHGDLSQLPVVENRAAQSWLLNAAGLSLLNIGQPYKAEGLFIRETRMQVEDKDWRNASTGYENLADLQFRAGRINEAIESSKNAFEMAEKTGSKGYQVYSKAYLAYTLSLKGDTEEAGKLFREADGLEREIDPDKGGLYSLWGVFYADFLTKTGLPDEAFKVSKRNLKICAKYNFINSISRCCRSLGMLERIKGNLEKADEHLTRAFDLACEVGIPALEIEALIERAKLKLEKEDLSGAEADLNKVLKLCEHTGFKLYEPDAELVLAKVYLKKGDKGRAGELVKSVVRKASDMGYFWPKKEAEELDPKSS